jgi:N-acetylneuraminic acid mutarotase
MRWSGEASAPRSRRAMRRGGVLAVVLALGFIAVAGVAVRADSWTLVASMPAPKVLHGAATGSDGRIYAFGGTGDEGPPVTATVFAYDVNLDAWTPVAPLAAGPRRNFAYTSDANGLVYAIGGYNFSGPPFGLARVERYDPTLDYWTSLPDMPTARQGPAATTGLDGRIYVMGGTNTSFQTIAVTEVFDPSTGAWATAAPMNTPRTGFAAVTGFDGLIYVFGGYSDTYVNTAEVYDPTTDTWSPIASMNQVRYSLAGVTGLDGRLYAIGGYLGGTSVEAYDPSSDTWTPVADLSMARSGHAATLGPDGRIYAIGGDGGGASVEAYTPD